MDNELFRNGSGYVDITAYKAMNNYRKEENRMEYRHGDIFEYETANGNYRFALIVSADFRSSDRFQSGILLTDEPKSEESVQIVCQGLRFADCNMVSLCDARKLGNYVKTVTDSEIEMVDAEIIKCLGLKTSIEQPVEVVKEVIKEVQVPSHEPSSSMNEEMAQAKAEAKVYKDLYESLLAKMIG